MSDFKPVPTWQLAFVTSWAILVLAAATAGMYLECPSALSSVYLCGTLHSFVLGAVLMYWFGRKM